MRDFHAWASTPMPHSYASIAVHVVFSTKERRAQLQPDIAAALFPYIGGIVTRLGGTPIIVNGVADHVHLLGYLSPTLSLAAFVAKVKGASSKWMHEALGERTFLGWQRGYAAFSVSRSNIDRVAEYVRDQQAHHARVSFRDEFVSLLRRHGINPDERYLWT